MCLQHTIMDFFCHLFFYTKIEKYCFFPINFQPVRKSARFFFFKKMVFFSTEKVQTLDLTLQIQRLKPLSHRGHFLHQFYLWDKSMNFHCPHTALFLFFFKFPLLQQQIVNFVATLSIKKKMVWGLKFILFKKHQNLCLAVFRYFSIEK